MYFEKYYVNL